MRHGVLVSVVAVGVLGFVLMLPRKRVKSQVKVTIGPAVIESDDPLERLIGVVEAEVPKWRELDDQDPEAWPMLDGYWDAVGVDGRALGYPWSGAFIAWATSSAVPGALPVSAQHSTYAHHALGQNQPGRFTTLPPDTPVRRGDIILKPRAGESHSFEELAADPFIPFPGHSDIVTEVLPHQVNAVGGNKMGHRVGIQAYTRLPDGTVPGLVAVLRLNPEATA